MEKAETWSENGLLPGFLDPVQDSLKTFRVLMSAMAHPGRKYGLPVLPQAPAPLYPSTAAVCLTLLDMDTPLWIDPSASSVEAVHYLKFHCGCTVTPHGAEAAFAVTGPGRSLPDLAGFGMGDPLYPHQSTTVLIQVESLSNLSLRGVAITGPGIAEEIRVHAEGLSDAFWPALHANNERFPQGVDVILISPTSLCGLPRTVRVSGSMRNGPCMSP